MQLQLYSEPLKDYLKSVGKDLAKLPRSEMRARVRPVPCGILPTIPATAPTKRPVFPWKNGFTPEAIYSVYEDNGNGHARLQKFADWCAPCFPDAHAEDAASRL